MAPEGTCVVVTRPLSSDTDTSVEFVRCPVNERVYANLAKCHTIGPNTSPTSEQTQTLVSSDSKHEVVSNVDFNEMLSVTNHSEAT